MLESTRDCQGKKKMSAMGMMDFLLGSGKTFIIRGRSQNI